MAENDRVAVFGIGKEGAETEGDRFNLDIIAVSTEDGDRIEGVLLGGDGVGGKGDGGSGSDIFDFLDGFNIIDGEIGLLERISGS